MSVPSYRPLVELDANGQLKRLNMHPGQMQAWRSQARFIFLLAGTQGGKCGRFRVLTASGERKFVADMQVGDHVFCLGPHQRIQVSTVTAVLDTGVQETYRVTTATGREIVVTGDHPLYGSEGWRPTRDFAVGDPIGVPAVIPVLGCLQPSVHEIWQTWHRIRETGEIPAIVYRWSRSALSVLLPGLVTARSLQTARDLQHLWLRLGGVMTIRQRDDGYLLRPVTCNKTVTTGDIYWDRIAAIVPLGPDHVYDITVDDGHNFIADDIFAHNTSWGPWWLHREIMRRGGGDFLAVTGTYDLFKLKMLPEILHVFVDILKIGRYWSGDRVLEIRDPETGEFWADSRSDDMWGRVILRSASAGSGKDDVGVSGLESATASGAWLDEVGLSSFTLAAWEAVLRRLSIHQGRVLGTTTLYNLGWLKQEIYDPWEAGDPEIDVIQFDSIENPAFPIAEYLERRQKMPAWKFDLMYRGRYAKPAGMIYCDFNESRHIVQPFHLPIDWKRFVGVDPGAVNTATVWLAHDKDTDRYYVYNESLEGGETSSGHVAAAIRRSGGSIRGIKFFGGAPSEHQFRMDWATAGCTVEQPPVSDVEGGIDRVIELMKTDRLYVFNTCSRLLAEIRSYSRQVDARGESTEKIQNKEKYHCFVAGTLVTTDHGQVPIEDIRIGDLVLTRAGFRPVYISARTGRRPIWELETETGLALLGTGDHPVFTGYTGFTPLQDLPPGDPLGTPTGVDHVRRVSLTGEVAPVYNLSVAGQPEYFANGILVHNCLDALRYAVCGLPKSTKAIDPEKVKRIPHPIPSMRFGKQSRRSLPGFH